MEWPLPQFEATVRGRMWLKLIRTLAGVGVLGLGLALLLRIPPVDGFIDAQVHFPYRGLEHLPVLPPIGLRIIAAILGASGVLLALARAPRIAAGIAAAATAYLFLIDSLYYESTAWLVILILVLLAAVRDEALLLFLLRFQIGCVYVFSGLSKLDADWLSGRTLRSMAPIYASIAGPAAIAGALFDLAVVPLLLWRRTRRAAFVAACLFHAHNAIVLRLGFVPWIALALTALFLVDAPPVALAAHRRRASFALAWMVVQIVIPLRGLVVGSDPAFDDVEYRFSWAMRSRSKASTATLVVMDRATGRVLERHSTEEDRAAWLGARLAGDPHALSLLARELAKDRDVVVHAETWVSLNGTIPSRLVDPEIDLARAPFPRFGAPSWVYVRGASLPLVARR